MILPAAIRDEYNRRGERKDVVDLEDFARWSYISSADWTDTPSSTSHRRAPSCSPVRSGVISQRRRV